MCLANKRKPANIGHIEDRLKKLTIWGKSSTETDSEFTEDDVTRVKECFTVTLGLVMNTLAHEEEKRLRLQCQVSAYFEITPSVPVKSLRFSLIVHYNVGVAGV